MYAWSFSSIIVMRAAPCGGRSASSLVAQKASVDRSASSSEGVVGHAGLAEARSVGAGGAVLALHQGQVAVGVRGQPVFLIWQIWHQQ